MVNHPPLKHHYLYRPTGCQQDQTHQTAHFLKPWETDLHPSVTFRTDGATKASSMGPAWLLVRFTWLINVALPNGTHLVQVIIKSLHQVDSLRDLRAFNLMTIAYRPSIAIL